MKNDFCHMELQTSDLGASRKFYEGMFSWKFESTPMGEGQEYVMITPGKGPMGGMMKNPAPGTPSGWLVYIAVEDIDASLARTEELGGKVLFPKTAVQDMGHFAILQDPTDAVFAVWEPAKKE